MRYSLLIGLMLCGVAFAAPIRAQDNGVVPAPAPETPAAPSAEISDIDRILQDEQLRIGLQESFQRKSKLRAPDVDPSQLTTLLFTLWQHELLLEAKALFDGRPVGEGESLAGNGNGEKPKGLREINLGGISYRSPESWTVWLNSVRITPNAIPKEVMDISVTQNYIELKWFDAYTNLIFPIRLRAHQRFNLDNRIFLPGEGTQ
jgi:hypothetical protein